MIGDLSEFVINFKDLLIGFKHRATKTQEVLADPSTCFVLVSSPNLLAIREAAYFLQQLDQQNLAFAGFIINRTLPLHALQPDSPDVAAVRAMHPAGRRRQFPLEPPPGTDPQSYAQLLEKLRDNLEGYLDLAEIDRANLTWLRHQTRAEHMLLQIPELPGDVHDLHGLATLAHLLSPSSTGPAPG